MIQGFCKWMLYGLLGWHKNVTVEHPKKYVLCLAPHTSNWDFFFGHIYSHAEGFRSNYLMKKEWFFWPLGPIFRKTGGIPVYRDKNMSMTENLARTACQEEDFHLTITPEGTRKLNPNWKKGFYYIAYGAKIPILLYALDYEKKTITCTKFIMPTGDFDKDFREIQEYYKDVKGKYPEKFSVGAL